ncbi:MAG: hypothetical protein QOD07_10 [Frankiaceae bacterium]|nr:hypothetical protein [Frankiaceae bacterium]
MTASQNVSLTRAARALKSDEDPVNARSSRRSGAMDTGSRWHAAALPSLARRRFVDGANAVGKGA